MKILLKILFSYFLVANLAVSAITIGSIYNTPTAVNPERGVYQIDFALHDLGEVSIRAGVGLSKYIYLGIVENVNGLVGSAPITGHLPGAIAKISFTGQNEEGLNIALGWDNLTAGAFSDFPVPVAGPYVAVTKGFFFKSESPHLATLGSKVALTREPYNAYLFASIYFRITFFFDWGMEFDNIALYQNPNYHFINNQVLAFNITENFSLKFAWQLAVNFNTIQQTRFENLNSRNVLVTYQNFF